MFFTSLGAYFAAQSGKAPFILTGTVRSGLPDFGLPPFSTTRADTNGTLVEMDFKDMVRNIILLYFLIVGIVNDQKTRDKY